MTQLVFVHGRAQQDKDADDLKQEWIAALRRGLAKTGLRLPLPDDHIRFPFYGDTLRDLATDRADVADVVVRGNGVGAEEATFVRMVLQEVRKQAGISDHQILTEADVADRVAVERGPQNWPWVLAVLRALDKYVPGTSAPSIATFTHDVYRYLRNIGIRDRIESGVRAAFTPAEPMVVVGHSLGSIVSYNLLRRDGAREGWTVPSFVTVGSPLAVTAIKRQLSPVQHPECVGRWFNAFDPRDVVALHPLDAAYFPTTPVVENKTDVDNPTENRHGISGYLEDADVARRIHAGLTRP
ncbi:hypothetical protein Amsp01_090660 [Amycolatopsis sp. NBRC 101858]|uniref:hypothetical protein n=1 Tax=Amycolatopsis sp. NBRC 101858 TaxID=3032200 RepID=UPI0024A3D4E0|nr:hypothetical protein [Amycolatopsis sp. NBRC 101858]GLY43043.1 hypothetical protein Amsp01_090660 [Amycolatopsis sp. NBRC 101858]